MPQKFRVRTLADIYGPPKIKAKLDPKTFTQPLLTNSPIDPPDMNAGLIAKTPYADAYREYLKSEPNKENLQLGTFPKILAAVSGVAEGFNRGAGAGIANTKSLLDRPYVEAMEGYARKGGRLKELAEMEYQSLTDAQKLALQNADLALKQRGQLLDELKHALDTKKTEAEVKNIASLIQSRGLSLQKNDVDGVLYVVDVNNKTRTPIDKFAESISEKDTRENTNWFNRYRTEQAGRKSLQEDAQEHAVRLEGIRNANSISLEHIRSANDVELAKIRSTLTRGDNALNRAMEQMTPAAQKSAMELAVYQTQLDHPDLEPSAEFSAEVRKRLNEIRRRATGESPVVNIWNDPTPRVNIPGNNNADAQARSALAEIGINNPTPAQIEEAKKDLGLR